MGVSTDGIISYGIILEEDCDFPWGDKDTDDWWLSELGYKPPFELFDDNGEYLNGVKPSNEKMSEYFDHRMAFKKANPMPFDVCNYCSGDYPMYMLAVPGSTQCASRGYPVEFDPMSLRVNEEAKEKFLKFCKDYMKIEKEPSWYLYSYWG